MKGLAWNGPMSETLSTAFITTRMKMLNYPSAIISDVAKLVYPYGSHVSNLLRQREWLTAMGGQSCEDVSSLPKPLWRLSHDVSKALCLSPEMSLRDLLSMKPNMLNCLRHMWPEVESTNMLTLVPSLEIPVLVLHGRHDNCTAHSLVEEYLNRLSAPVKKLVWFEKSG